MKKPLIFLLVLIVVSVGALYMPSHKNNDPTPEQIVLAWTGLDSYPTWANANLSIDTEGGQFTRQFNIQFNGTAEQLSAWADSQKVLKNAKVSVEKEKIFQYKLEPQQGASYATVIINYINNTVRITTYWN